MFFKSLLWRGTANVLFLFIIHDTNIIHVISYLTYFILFYSSKVLLSSLNSLCGKLVLSFRLCHSVYLCCSKVYLFYADSGFTTVHLNFFSDVYKRQVGGFLKSFAIGRKWYHDDVILFKEKPLHNCIGSVWFQCY